MTIVNLKYESRFHETGEESPPLFQHFVKQILTLTPNIPTDTAPRARWGILCNHCAVLFELDFHSP